MVQLQEIGKSTFLELLTKTVGKENTSHVTMHKLEERFQASRVIDKLLNTAGEIERRAIERMETFKAIVTGDEQEFEIKYSDPFSATPFCKMIWRDKLFTRI